MKVRGKSRINGPWSGFVQAPVESWGVKRSLRKSQWETRHRLAMKICVGRGGVHTGVVSTDGGTET